MVLSHPQEELLGFFFLFFEPLLVYRWLSVKICLL